MSMDKNNTDYANLHAQAIQLINADFINYFKHQSILILLIRTVKIIFLFLICTRIYLRASQKKIPTWHQPGNMRFSAFSQFLKHLSRPIRREHVLVVINNNQPDFTICIYNVGGTYRNINKLSVTGGMGEYLAKYSNN